MLFSVALLALPVSALLSDGGFEKANEADTEWRPYEQGYSVDRTQAHSGRQSIQCANTSENERRGAIAIVQLNQKAAAPIVVSGWSKCTGADGSPSSDYSIYLDLTYTDGTPLWGQIAAFAPSNSGWQKKTVTVFPTKPVKSMNLYLLFRNKKGTAWFDDIEAKQLKPSDSFDSQALLPPKLEAGKTRQWFIRDVAAGSPLIPINRSEELQLAASESSGKLTVENKTNGSRALTVYCCEKFEPAGAVWYDDIRTSRSIAPNMEYAKLTLVPNQGATGGLSLYPFGCVANEKSGLMLGVPALSGPSIVRFFYNAPSKALVAACDVALVPGTKHNQAAVVVQSKRFSPEWGFRRAASEYYRLNQDAYVRRAKAEGIWMPFLDPAKVPNVEDFGVAYHEGDNSVESDAKKGILSFRYTEPMTWWMPMPKETPRTYEAALAMVKKHAAGSNSNLRSWAQSVLNSGSVDSSGKYNVEFQDQPWANGAVWVLNPNPNLPRLANEQTKATLSYTAEMAKRIYEKPQSGEYLDSIEGWANYLDFRPAAISASSYTPTFATDSLKPTIPIWFGVYELAQMMGGDLHARNKLLMANSTPWRIHAFLPLLDVSGTETNWNPNNQWQPDSDEIMNLRRTLSYRKPYLLLQNTDFDKFNLGKLERYLQRSMFYAVFPSMFSQNASEKVYWENPKLYEAGRPLFKKYIPMIQKLSSAGWEPITWAKTNQPKLYIERYGKQYLTVFNDSNRVLRGMVNVNIARINSGWEHLVLVNALTGTSIGEIDRTRREVKLELKPEECLVIEMRQDR